MRTKYPLLAFLSKRTVSVKGGSFIDYHPFPPLPPLNKYSPPLSNIDQNRQ